jgi:RNA polymerase sigma-70 factor (ECF subfamily)
LHIEPGYEWKPMIDEKKFSETPILITASQLPFDNQEFLKKLRRLMLRFAASRLYDNHLAEDAVQEALIGAFSGQSSFSARASFQTWTLGILKHKISDVLRTKSILSEIGLECSGGDGDDIADPLTDTMPDCLSGQVSSLHRDPERALAAGRFWTAFESALRDLPGIQADVFVKHELSSLRVNEICEEMAINEGNFYVLMHRARKQLKSSMAHCKDGE